jgi:hypothetical protein
MHKNNIIYNLILRLSYCEWNQKFLSHPNFSIFIQQLKLIWLSMLRCIQVQLSNQSWASNISTTTIINYHITYLIINITPSMKEILFSLLYILFTNLNTQISPHNQRFSLHIIFHITTIIDLWHHLQIILTSRFHLTIISYNYTSFIWTFMCIMPKPLTLKTPNLSLMLRLSNIFPFFLQSRNLLPNKWRFGYFKCSH